MASERTIPIAGPSIGDKEVAAVTEAAASSWYEGAGVIEARFECEFARYVGRRYAISLPSCTSAIHLSLAAFGVGPGDEVIVPDATWIASSAPISYVGATPVFADVDPSTWCLSADSAETRLSSRTRAVIAVDLYGGMPALDRLEEMCAAHGIPLIEDAAEAIGSAFRGRPAGSFGTTSVFSFHGSKTLTTGEGGMLLTDDRLLYERMLFLRDHGRQPGSTDFQNGEVAYKYKMSALQAALGLAQLGRIDELVTRKRTIFRAYADRLSDLPLSLNAEPEDTINSYWMSTVVLKPGLGIDKEAVQAALARQGIATRPFFRPLSSLPAYKDHPSAGNAPDQQPVSQRLGRDGFNLPSALRLEEEDVDLVSAAVRRIVTSSGPRGR